jgi:hypothetical protein
VRPGLGRLAEPVGQCHTLLAAVSAHADHHRQADLVLLEADLEVDAVDPQVHVIDVLQRPLAELRGVVLPCSVSRVIVAADRP